MAEYGANAVSVINTSTNTVTTTVPVGTGPEGVAVTPVTPSGSTVYVANLGANTTSVINTATNTVTTTIPVGSEPSAWGEFIVPPTRTASPVITTPVYAGATSVSGTAVAGASVVLTYRWNSTGRSDGCGRILDGDRSRIGND